MSPQPIVWVFTICCNEETLMPYFLRHYSTFAAKIIVWDAGSTDRTREIIQECPIAELREFPQPGVFDDVYLAEFADQQFPEARGQADWCMWVDADEFIYHPAILDELHKHQAEGATILNFDGYQMFGERPPAGPGQIYAELNRGVRGYRKPGCVFSPELHALRWSVGKHTCRPVGNVRYPLACKLKLLHYRYLGLDYLLQRNTGNYSRQSERNTALRLGYHVYPAYWPTMVKEYEAGLQTAQVVFQSPFAELIDKIHQGINPYAGFPVEHWPADEFGWDSQHPWFAELIEELRPPVIVEVGSFLGRSARHMAACLKDQGLDSAVVCIDTWLAEHILWTNAEHRPRLRMRHGRPEFYNVFMANTLAAGLQDYIVPVPMPSVSAARLLRALEITAPLIYIDGSHEAGDVYRDLAFFYDLVLEPGGVMLIDDYNYVDLDMMHGLLRDVHQFCRDRGLQLNVSGWKALIRKPPALRPYCSKGPAIEPGAGETALALVTAPDLAAAIQAHLPDLTPQVLHILRQNAELAQSRGAAGAPWLRLVAGLEEIMSLQAAAGPAPESAAGRLQALLEAPDLLAAVHAQRAHLDAALLELVQSNAAAARADGDAELAEGLDALAGLVAEALAPRRSN